MTKIASQQSKEIGVGILNIHSIIVNKFKFANDLKLIALIVRKSQKTLEKIELMMLASERKYKLMIYHAKHLRYVGILINCKTDIQNYINNRIISASKFLIL